MRQNFFLHRKIRFSRAAINIYKKRYFVSRVTFSCHHSYINLSPFFLFLSNYPSFYLSSVSLSLFIFLSFLPFFPPLRSAFSFQLNAQLLPLKNSIASLIKYNFFLHIYLSYTFVVISFQYLNSVYSPKSHQVIDFRRFLLRKMERENVKVVKKKKKKKKKRKKKYR